MANPTTLKGAKFYVCTTAQNSDLDQAGFEALTFVEAGKVVEHGSIAATESDLSIDLWGTNFRQHRKGIKDGGSTTLMISYDPDDAGEAALDSAAATDDEYAFKIDLGDNAGGTSNTILYYRGPITIPTYELGNTEAFVNKTYTIMNNQAVIQVDPV